MALKRYRQRHVSQYDGSRYERANCTPTSVANGVAASTGGRKRPTGASMRALIARSEEYNPRTPGWALEDLDRACAKLGVGFEIHSGEGWAALERYRRLGHYIVLQGDSDRFGDSTCSGAFDGDHCIGVHPNTDVNGMWRIDDPICKTFRVERETVLRAYAAKLSTTIRFGVFTTKVPLV